MTLYDTSYNIKIKITKPLISKVNMKVLCHEKEKGESQENKRNL